MEYLAFSHFSTHKEHKQNVNHESELQKMNHRFTESQSWKGPERPSNPT